MLKRTINFVNLLTGLSLYLSSAHVSAEDMVDYYKKYSSTEQYCKLKTLKELGWQIEQAPVDQADSVLVKTGTPCHRGNLGEAVTNGDLRISLKIDPTAVDFSNNRVHVSALNDELDSILYGKGTLCTYKYKLGDAAVMASKKLEKNVADGNFRFGIGTESFCEVEGDEWEPVKPSFDFLSPQKFNLCLKAKRSPQAAIQCFYDKKCKAECAIGLQVGELATQEALYEGKMDKAFENEEMSVGEWINLTEKTKNPFHSQDARNKANYDSNGQNMSQLGAQYMVGVSGYIGNLYGERFLDSPNDRGENYMIVSVDSEAIASLQKSKGFTDINAINKNVWDMNNKVLNDGTLSDDEREELREKIQKIITEEPVYKGITVFVHPLGLMTFGDHISRLLQINPRTPYTISLYPENINGDLFKRYIKHKVKDCVTSQSGFFSNIFN